MLRRLLTDSKGATAIEYAFIAMMIALAAIGGMKGLGGQLSNTFNTVSTKMAN
ncbi:Flp family type IVb pilin [Sphingomonas sp. BK235]|jgi:pilus assembly protein Flp/PilA|uniref:Flp family type IVb pilin n=1 Tax=Sphingomonas sp. BK235 TaxID=2512131 RepID=UPI001046438B|nr:Flp family type IVb pilin [Sphingomonas sp. BK235]TCP34693.1 pilus assembly protein Flp/PilA [Sphingomonas sp. BK235]